MRIIQCDVTVTVDEWVEAASLGEYRISGYGGSDMAPALVRLAEDPEVQSAIVITDGDIDYPESAPPFDVLWVLTLFNPRFQPEYGNVLHLGDQPVSL